MHSLDSAHDRELSLNPATVYFGDSCKLGLRGSLEDRDSELTLAPADYHTLLEELAQAQKRDRDRCTRIHHLEQALDQALVCIEELRLQVQDQQLLETQLANTEDYASVQQQAIVRLKLQLSEQQVALDAQILETQQRDQAIQELLATIESMTQAQQREVERLRSRLAQDQLEVQTHRSRLGKHLQDLQFALESRQQRVAELEAETLAARTLSSRLQSQLEGSQQQIKELSTRLVQHRSQLVQLESQFEQSQAGSQSFSLGAQAEVASQRLVQQVQWQQQQQELETDRGRLQNRVSDLEQQVAEMQEQILRQAQQEAEYETAVQYWKDRYSINDQQISHLKALAEQLLHPGPESNPVLLELLQVLQVSPLQEAASGSKPIAPLPLPRLATVELPEFLVRRRAAQKGSASKTSTPESLSKPHL